MHQHAPASAPHSNEEPQRPQVRRRSGNRDSVGARLMVALLGVIAREINHPGVTGLRQSDFVGPLLHGIFFHSRRAWLPPRSMTMISTTLALKRKEYIDDRPVLLDHAEWS
jgi:hypothetical protein